MYLFVIPSPQYWTSNPFIPPPGYALWLQVICLTFWWHWPQHVPCWQGGVQLICTRSGFHNQRNLPVPWRAWNLPLLSHRYFKSVWILCARYRIVWSSCLFMMFFGLSLTTEYCGTFCYPNVPQSPYLHTVGEKLLPGIDVLWTGESNTVSCQLTKTIPTGKRTVAHAWIIDWDVFSFLQAPRWCPKISQWSLLRKCQKS